MKKNRTINHFTGIFKYKITVIDNENSVIYTNHKHSRRVKHFMEKNECIIEKGAFEVEMPDFDQLECDSLEMNSEPLYIADMIL